MPRKTTPRIDPAQTPVPAPLAAASPALTDDQINRWAAVIADGRDPFPEYLPPAERERLLAVVRERLRGGLIKLIARAIALRLHGRARQGEHDPC